MEQFGHQPQTVRWKEGGIESASDYDDDDDDDDYLYYYYYHYIIIIIISIIIIMNDHNMMMILLLLLIIGIIIEFNKLPRVGLNRSHEISLH